MRIAAADSGFTDPSETAGVIGLRRALEVEKSESRACGSIAAAAASNLPMLGPVVAPVSGSSNARNKGES